MRPLMLIALALPTSVMSADPLPLPFPEREHMTKPTTPCFCRSKIGKRPLGDTICLRKGDRMVTMRCELVLNNTSWREVSEGCDVAEAS